jgi:hypothetical protein
MVVNPTKGRVSYEPMVVNPVMHDPLRVINPVMKGPFLVPFVKQSELWCEMARHTQATVKVYRAN